MRTTVTLDADVEQRLRDAMRAGGTSFKQTLNDALRRGLGVADDAGGQFDVEARPMGLRAGIDPARLREIDDYLEIDEVLRKTARLTERGP